MKVGIIRCMQTEDFCPGTTDFRMIREKKGAFEGVEEDIEIIGFINCGGCPGKKAVLRARELVNRGADSIAFASCIQKGTPIGYACPFAKRMKDVIQNDLGDGIRLIDYTHEEDPVAGGKGIKKEGIEKCPLFYFGIARIIQRFQLPELLQREPLRLLPQLA